MPYIMLMIDERELFLHDARDHDVAVGGQNFDIQLVSLQQLFQTSPYAFWFHMV